MTILIILLFIVVNIVIILGIYFMFLRKLSPTSGYIRLAIIIAVLYFTNVISGTLAIILLVFGAVFVLTSTVGFCPLYLPFGISTKKEEK